MTYWIIFVLELVILLGTSRFLFKTLFLLLYQLTRSRAIAIHVVAILFFPGVVIHELSHLLAAGLLFVPVYDVEFVPHLEENKFKLGSVQLARTDLIRRFLVGVAPILGGVSILVVILGSVTLFSSTINSFELGARVGVYAAIAYSIFVISNTLFSSKKDLEGAGALVIFLFVVGIFLYLLNPNFFSDVSEFFTTPQSLHIIENVIFLLSIPVGMNLIVTMMFVFLLKRTD